ncbi:hypothetical protein [Rhodobacteraceae bacterium DSL-40]|uniref:hypothetical protein n=1 Tax=Amaricoccus sp. B4 TaxID=3368557 RepID=UPI000DAD7469
MYLPEDNDQMFEILVDLRLYAAMNSLPDLAEELDDALVLLQTEIRRADGRSPVSRKPPVTDQG